MYGLPASNKDFVLPRQLGNEAFLHLNEVLCELYNHGANLASKWSLVQVAWLHLIAF